MIGTIDRDRQRVYDAEEHAFGGTTMAEPLEWPEVEVVVAAITADPWWAGLSLPPVVLERTRADAGTSCSDGRRVRIAPGGQDAVTVAHELTHHACSHLPWPGSPTTDPAHGPRFRATALRVVALVGGTLATRQLSAAWVAAGLSVADWSWDEPSDRPPRALRGVRVAEPLDARGTRRACTPPSDVAYRS